MSLLPPTGGVSDGPGGGSTFTPAPDDISDLGYQVRSFAFFPEPLIFSSSSSSITSADFGGNLPSDGVEFYLAGVGAGSKILLWLFQDSNPIPTILEASSSLLVPAGSGSHFRLRITIFPQVLLLDPSGDREVNLQIYWPDSPDDFGFVDAYTDAYYIAPNFSAASLNVSQRITQPDLFYFNNSATLSVAFLDRNAKQYYVTPPTKRDSSLIRDAFPQIHNYHQSNHARRAILVDGSVEILEDGDGLIISMIYMQAQDGSEEKAVYQVDIDSKTASPSERGYSYYYYSHVPPTFQGPDLSAPNQLILTVQEELQFEAIFALESTGIVPLPIFSWPDGADSSTHFIFPLTIEYGSELPRVTAKNATQDDITDRVNVTILPPTHPTAVTVHSESSFQRHILGMHTATYTVSDKLGYSSTATRSYNNVDTVGPHIFVNDAYRNPSLSHTIEVEQGSTVLIRAENHPFQTPVSLTVSNFDTQRAAGTYNFSTSATDDSGNSTSLNVQFVIKDTRSPEIRFTDGWVSGDGTTFVDVFTGSLPLAEAYDFIPEEISLGSVSPTFSPAFDLDAVGTYDATFAATDAGGNDISVTRIFEVRDRVPPKFFLNDVHIGLVYPHTYDIATDTTLPSFTAKDPHYDATTTVQQRVQLNTIKDSQTLVYESNDSVGNLSRLYVPLTFVDSTKSLSLTNEFPRIPITFDEVDTKESPSPYAPPVADTMPPSITINGVPVRPATTNYTLELSQGTTQLPVIGAIDQQTTDTVTLTQNGTIDPNVPGTYIVSYSAHDGTNTTTLNISYNVIGTGTADPTLPVITVNGTQQANGTTLVFDVQQYATTDDLPVILATGDDDVTLYSVPTLNTSLLGKQSVTYTASDGTYDTVVIIEYNVKDITPPVITVNGTQQAHGTTLALTIPQYTASEALPRVEVSDENDVTLSSVPALNTALPGKQTVTYTASDGTNNTVLIIEYDVEAVDAFPPEIYVNGVAYANGASQTIILERDDPDPIITPTDNVAVASFTTQGSLNRSEEREQIVVYTASDGTNTTVVTITYDVRLGDVTPPTIVVNGVDYATGSTVYLVKDASPPVVNASDTHEGIVRFISVTASSVIDMSSVGTQAITYTASDSASPPNTASKIIFYVIEEPDPINPISSPNVGMAATIAPLSGNRVAMIVTANTASHNLTTWRFTLDLAVDSSGNLLHVEPLSSGTPIHPSQEQVVWQDTDGQTNSWFPVNMFISENVATPGRVSFYKTGVNMYAGPYPRGNTVPVTKLIFNLKPGVTASDFYLVSAFVVYMVNSGTNQYLSDQTSSTNMAISYQGM